MLIPEQSAEWQEYVRLVREWSQYSIGTGGRGRLSDQTVLAIDAELTTRRKRAEAAEARLAEATREGPPDDEP